MFIKIVVFLFVFATGILESDGVQFSSPTTVGSNTTTTEKGGTCPCKSYETFALSYSGECNCRCIPTRETINRGCFECPDYLNICERTCCFRDVVCDGNGYCTSTDGIDFVTAAKFAVLFALVVTCFAVLIALFRAFFLPRCCQGRLRRIDPDSSSLNSVQRFVLERLATRPPPYDHQPEKPPSYEECMESPDGPEIPPPSYGVAVISMGGAVPQAPEVPAPDLLSSIDTGTADVLSTPSLELNANMLAVSVRRENEVERNRRDILTDQGGVENRAFENEEITTQDKDASTSVV